MYRDGVDLRCVSQTIRHSLVPVPAELEFVPCPLCSGAGQERLLQHDSFGFPVGLARCLTCGFVFSNPRPTERYVERFYRRFYLAFYEGHRTFSEHYVRHHMLREAASARVQRYAHLVPTGGSVLDIGSGAGMFLAELRRHRPDITLHGVEPGRRQARFARNALGLDVVEGRYQDLTPTHPYDLITAFHVLEHLHDLAGFFGFCKAALSSTGRLIVESPNVEGGWSDLGFFHLAHVNAFSPSTLTMAAAHFGFASQSLHTSERGWDRPNLHAILTPSSRTRTLGQPIPLSPQVRERLAALPDRRWYWVVKSWLKLTLHFAGLGVFLDRWRARRHRRTT